MITGALKSKIDSLWDSFWSGGISNPLEVMEQITYLLFLQRLDDLQMLAENKANRLGTPIESPVFPEGDDASGSPFADMRWSNLKNFAPDTMYEIFRDRVFPFLRALGGEGSTDATHMTGTGSTARRRRRYAPP
jgi:type I restriction enzyme M protein